MGGLPPIALWTTRASGAGIAGSAKAYCEPSKLRRWVRPYLPEVWGWFGGGCVCVIRVCLCVCPLLCVCVVVCVNVGVVSRGPGLAVAVRFVLFVLFLLFSECVYFLAGPAVLWCACGVRACATVLVLSVVRD